MDVTCTLRASHSAVVPAKAGTHNHRRTWLRAVSATLRQ